MTAAPTSMTTAGRRAQLGEIRTRRGTHWTGGQGESALDPGAIAGGAGDGSVAADQQLEFGAAVGTAVLVDRHCQRMADR